MPCNDAERAELAKLRIDVRVLKAQMEEVLAILAALTVERPSMARAAGQARAGVQ